MKKFLYQVAVFVASAINVMNGRFGKKVLKRKYRIGWKIFTYTAFVICVMGIMFKFFELWDVIVSFLNHVIWG